MANHVRVRKSATKAAPHHPRKVTSKHVRTLAQAKQARRLLLDEYFRLQARLEDLADPIELASGPQREALLGEEYGIFRRLHDLRDVYRQLVPQVPIARDPFTGEVFRHAVDVWGLDGLWWNYEGPIRPHEPLPASLVAVTGAVRLKGTPEPFPFLCRPGPEVPYVLPRLLEHDAVAAAISAVSVGAHTGFAITYFSEYPLDRLVRANTWGTGEYAYADSAGRYHWYSVDEDEDGVDTDLRPWIKAKKLAWVAPGDRTMKLRSTVTSCPYVGLKGSAEPQRVRWGMTWHRDDPPRAPERAMPWETG